ncbi:MAG: hypothetical protein PUE30_01610 [Spirochaetia bacterium]|nr:hypothetical protein [Spirochaetia bacterium]
MAVQKNIEEKKTKTEEKITKTVKVKILETLRGTYGAFNPGETAELDAKTADTFIKAGLAEKA